MSPLNWIFKKNKDKLIQIFSPIDGEIVSLEKTPDEAFASGAIGEGVAIIPAGDTLFAPCGGSEFSIFETNHALSIDVDGVELIVHFGVDTVKLKGAGFTRLYHGSGTLKKGTPLIKYNLEYINKNAKSSITPVVISNMEIVDSIEKRAGRVKAGDLLFTVKLK